MWVKNKFINIHLLSILLIFVNIRADNSRCYTDGHGVCVNKATPNCPFTGGQSIEKDSKGRTLCDNPERRCCTYIKPKPIERRDIKCGRRKFSGDFKIHGGTKAALGQYPWHASLYKFGRQLCGATVIDENWVITAAHCFDGNETNVKSYAVTVADVDFTEPTSDLQRSNIKQLILHKAFHHPDVKNDIALVELETPFIMGDFVRKACLPERDETFSNMPCDQVGHGATEKSFGSRVLLQTVSPLVNNTECQRQYCAINPIEDNEIYDTNICAGFKFGVRDTCQGDSGGQLGCPMPTKRAGKSQYVLAGLVSYGEGCAKKNAPGVYTRLTSYLDWIEYHTGLPVFDGSLANAKKNGQPFDESNVAKQPIKCS